MIRATKLTRMLPLARDAFARHTRTLATQESKPRVGWIGCGVMGSKMVGHLINAGFPATVYSRTQSKTEPLVAMGARQAASPAEVAKESDIIFSIVGYPSDVRSVILGPEGVLNGETQGKIVVDMTTSEPTLAKDIERRAQELQYGSLDAPVSGGDIGAAEARLSIMIGGDKGVVDTVDPLFRVMGKNIVHMGPAGSGQHTKMANQILISTTMVGLCEGFLYAKRAGLPLEQVVEAVGPGAAGSFSLSAYGPRIIKGDFAPGFFIEHFVKDMGIALAEAKAMRLSLPGLALAEQLYVAAMAQGHCKSGTQALILALDHLSHRDGGSC